MFYNFPDVIMYRREVSNVPGGLVDGEVGAGDLMEALWLRLEEENVANNDGQEEEESGSDGESVGGSCSNPEEMNESEEDYEEDPPGLLPDEDEDEDEDEDHEEHGRAKRITCQRITVGDTMNDDDYR